ncbi:hypothetical protein [Myroides odoratimimus]|uniref:hypothetical protein n=1 Tax=Myroides odoratimimus TaxID=76832 RepID=UPI00046A322C|nr:hypothetical protein [Myroides odoratimimus]
MKKSYNQLIGIILGKLTWFVGIGAILSMVLVLNKKLPDTAGWVFLVVLPFFIVGIVYSLFKCCNSISFEGDHIIIKTFKGDKMLYSVKDIQDIDIVEHRSSGVLMGYTLVLTMGGQPKKVWNLSGYNEKTLKEIIGHLPDEVDV